MTLRCGAQARAIPNNVFSPASMDCTLGEQQKAGSRLVLNCACDFESKFKHAKNANDGCDLVPGTTPLLGSDAACRNGDEFWYERTAYRLIPYSSCTDGERGLLKTPSGFREMGQDQHTASIVAILPLSLDSSLALRVLLGNGLLFTWSVWRLVRGDDIGPAC